MDSEVGGQIHGISLDSFLQMAQMEKTTCTLTVRAGDELGFMYLLKGELIAAETGVLTGQEAACEIISWTNTVIEIQNTCSKKTNEINLPLMNLLMEGLKLRDEKIAALKAAGGPLKPTGPPATDQKPAPGSPEQAAVRAGMDDFKDLSKPAEKIERKAPPEAKRTDKKPSPIPGARKKAKKGFPVKPVAIAAVVIVLVIGGIFVTGVLKSAEKDYRAVMEQVENTADLSGRINLLKEFIGSHKPGEYTQKAEKKMKELQAVLEKQDFDAVMLKVSQLPMDDNYEKSAVALYNQYLAKYPQSRFAAEAKQKIAEIPRLLDEADYEKVKNAAQYPFNRKIAVYTQYLERHPGGAYRTVVETLLSEMSESYFRHLKEETATCDENEDWENCITLCSNFIAAFKDNPHLEEVIALKIKLKGKHDLAKLRQAAEQKGTDYPAARQVYLSYLEAHPDAIIKGQIQDQLDRIEEKIEKRTQWERLAADSKNSQKNIFDRMSRLEKYIAQNPSGPYVNEAKKLMEQLAVEKQAAEAQRRKTAEQSRRLARIQLEKEKRQREKARRLKLEQSVIARLKKSGGRFRANGNGTVTDSTTGLTWTLLDSQLDLGKCLNYASAENYVKGLKTGGYRDWRMPTAGELAGIYKNPPFFPAGGAAWYWSSEAYVKGYHRIANIVTTKQETVFNIEQERQDRCGAVRAVRP